MFFFSYLSISRLHIANLFIFRFHVFSSDSACLFFLPASTVSFLVIYSPAQPVITRPLFHQGSVKDIRAIVSLFTRGMTKHLPKHSEFHISSPFALSFIFLPLILAGRFFFYLFIFWLRQFYAAITSLSSCARH